MGMTDSALPSSLTTATAVVTEEGELQRSAPPTPAQAVQGVLHLWAQEQRPVARVRWSTDTVDNEHLGRKKSNGKQPTTSLATL